MCAALGTRAALLSSVQLVVGTKRVFATTLDVARRAGARLAHDRTLGLAAEMAFWLFLSLLPLAAVAGLVVAKVTVDGGAVHAPFLKALPPAGRELVENELARVAAWRGGQVGVGAALMFVWLASSGIASIFDGVELEADAKPRTWLRKRLLAIATCVAMSVGLAIVAFIQTGVTGVTEWAHPNGKTTGVVDHPTTAVVRAVIGYLVTFGLVAGLYWVALPREARARMPILPGAAFALAVQTVVGHGYTLYLRTLGDGGAYQAGLASIGVTMISLFLLCLALLLGVELNQWLGERKARSRPPAPPKPARHGPRGRAVPIEEGAPA